MQRYFVLFSIFYVLLTGKSDENSRSNRILKNDSLMYMKDPPSTEADEISYMTCYIYICM